MKIIVVLLAGIMLLARTGAKSVIGQPDRHDKISRGDSILRSPHTFEQRIKNEIDTIDTYGIDRGYILSVAMHESGFGKGRIFKRTRNLYSLTVERSKSKCYCVRQWSCFQDFKTTRESTIAFVDRLSSNPRYGQVARGRISHWHFFMGLQTAGYATDKSYALKLDRLYHEVCKRTKSCESHL